MGKIRRWKPLAKHHVAQVCAEYSGAASGVGGTPKIGQAIWILVLFTGAPGSYPPISTTKQESWENLKLGWCFCGEEFQLHLERRNIEKTWDPARPLESSPLVHPTDGTIGRHHWSRWLMDLTGEPTRQPTIQQTLPFVSIQITSSIPPYPSTNPPTISNYII